MTVIGTMKQENGKGTVRMEDVFDTDIDDLWSAITEPNRLARWLAVVTGDPQGTMQVSFRSSWEGPMTVTHCEAPHRLVVSSGEGDDITETEAVLTAEGDRTRLVIEERGLPLEDVSMHGAGWQVHVEDLEALIEGREIEEWRPRWHELAPVYQAKPVAAAPKKPRFMLLW